MNAQQAKAGWVSAILLVAMALPLTAANYYWIGEGLSGQWSDGGNWVDGVAPSGSGHTLYFWGTQGLWNDNNALTEVNGIVFQKGSGPFTIEGGGLTLDDGRIDNYSSETQNIAIPLTLVGGTSSAHKNLYIDTARGDIISHIGIGRTNQYVDLVKQGLGTLTLYGNNNISSNNLSGGRAIIQGGRLVVDYSPGLTSHFYVSKIHFEGNSGTFEVKGTPVNSTAWTLETVTGSSNAAYRLILDSAVNMGSMYVGSGNRTLNVALTTAQASLTFSSPAGMTNGIYTFATVTDTGGTSLMTHTGGSMHRFSAYDGVLGVDSVSGWTQNFTASGDRSIGWAPLNSLTITGSGTLTGSSDLDARAYMVQDSVGAGGYVINSRIRGVSGPVTIHQYNTLGALTLNNRIQNENSTEGLAKTGPGTVIIGATSISSYQGATYIQQGLLELQGQLTRTGQVHIYDGGRLAGSGAIGATTATALTVWAGGKLEASTVEALDITGDVLVQDFGSLVFTLGDGESTDYLKITGTVTLEEYANLDFILDRVPLMSEDILLLQANSIVGTFSTINGRDFNGSLFDVEYEGVDYYLSLYVSGNEIWVSAIPEPATVTLWIGLVGSALLYYRRRCRRGQ